MLFEINVAKSLVHAETENAFYLVCRILTFFTSQAHLLVLFALARQPCVLESGYIQIGFLPLGPQYIRGLGFYVLGEHLVGIKQEILNKWNRQTQILWHRGYFWQLIMQLLRNSFKAISRGPQQ